VLSLPSEQQVSGTTPRQKATRVTRKLKQTVRVPLKTSESVPQNDRESRVEKSNPKGLKCQSLDIKRSGAQELELLKEHSSEARESKRQRFVSKLANCLLASGKPAGLWQNNKSFHQINQSTAQANVSTNMASKTLSAAAAALSNSTKQTKSRATLLSSLEFPVFTEGRVPPQKTLGGLKSCKLT